MEKEGMRRKGKWESKETLLVLTLIFSSLLLLIPLTIAIPSGPSNINITSNTTGTAATGTPVNISGGYISKLNLTATTQNPHWKGFAGWIDGRFTLDDSSGSTLYDWTLSSVSGEVYATRNSTTASWTEVACANSTQIDAEDTYLSHIGEDNISSTFSGTNTGTFIVAGKTISAGTCSSTYTYVNNVSQSTDFEEVLLYDNQSIIFTTILEQDATGYDGNTYDFQMIAPENGNESLGWVTAYYFYVELS